MGGLKMGDVLPVHAPVAETGISREVAKKIAKRSLQSILDLIASPNKPAIYHTDTHRAATRARHIFPISAFIKPLAIAKWVS